MQCQLVVQDPLDENTNYLFESILDAANGASDWEAIYAFATRDGVEALLSDEIVQNFLERSPLRLTVGIDAITNRSTLVRLQEISHGRANLNVNVFDNPTGNLFHPKISKFEYRDGSRCLIVGSGNLTPAGLQTNYEMYSIIKAEPRENLDLTSLAEFLTRNAENIVPINDEMLERASRNEIRGPRRPGRRVVPQEAERRRFTRTADIIQRVETRQRVVQNPTAQVLIAEIPKAGNRWHQVHFNRAVIDSYFRVRPNSSQRVFLTENKLDGTLSEQEARPCVFSQTNKNLKIELGARNEAPYPNQGRPIAIFRRNQLRVFDYILLMPNDPGYRPILRLLNQTESIGKGLKRVIVSEASLRTAWPNSPLLNQV